MVTPVLQAEGVHLQPWGMCVPNYTPASQGGTEEEKVNEVHINRGRVTP